MLFFDGIRHAGEIADLSYGRLKSTLTELAVNPYGHPAHELTTSAFLDAWALVDVIDRFRALWKLLPNAEHTGPKGGERSFSEVTEPVRQLRNVTDHLAERSEYVVAKRGTAMGSLTWFTMLDQQSLSGAMCTLVPGTIQSGTFPACNPAGKDIELPTGYVHLTAAEHTANLSDAFQSMTARVVELENSLEVAISKLGLAGAQAGSDLLLKLFVKFNPQDIPASEA